MTSEPPVDVVVVGGGLLGLATARELSSAGAGRVVVLERFRLGHGRGSSHGASRMCRSTYPDPLYVRLMHTARAEDWPRLERDRGRRLLDPRPGCFFGPPGGLYEAFRRGVASFPEEIEELSPGEAARRFPHIRFEGMGGALRDRTAAVIRAQETMEALATLCARQGVEVREETRALELDLSGDPIRVRTNRGDLTTSRLVVTAGPWALSLLPFLASRLTALRQTVGYFLLEERGPEFTLESAPVWAYLGAGGNDFFYGIPEPARGVMKAARHVTQGPGDDPEGVADPEPTALETLHRFLDRHFTTRVRELRDADTCYYTATSTEDFILDYHPQDPRVVIGAGCSGHGFKFGPLTGRILAELCLHGRTTVADFEENRATFAIPGTTVPRASNGDPDESTTA